MSERIHIIKGTEETREFDHREQKDKLREKIARLICPLSEYSQECTKCGTGQGCPDNWVEVSEKVDQFIAIIEPLIEEAKQDEYIKWVKALMECSILVSKPEQLKGIVSRLLEEAKKQERERERTAEMVLKDAQTAADFPSFHAAMVAWAVEALK